MVVNSGQISHFYTNSIDRFAICMYATGAMMRERLVPQAIFALLPLFGTFRLGSIDHYQ